MTKKNESRKAGIMTKREHRFLYWNEQQKKKFCSDVAKRKYYQRIVNGANEAFRDFNDIIAKLPEKQLARIEFESGLNSIHKALGKKGLKDRTPLKAVEEAILNLDLCLGAIGKYNKNLLKIAEPEFNLVKDWLYVVQKFPKEKGAGI